MGVLKNTRKKQQKRRVEVLKGGGWKYIYVFYPIT